MAFLAQMWPSEHLAQLAPRAALLCEGSALQKVVRLDANRLKTSDTKGVELLVTTLGGVWGKTVLENKYEVVEKALYGTSQKGDETNDSYLARHEILFEDAISQGATLTDLRAYILLRNSGLSIEDKKRVIIESGGSLDYAKVTSAIRMLGSRFFQDVQGVSKASQRSKVYDVNVSVESEEETFWTEEQTGSSYDAGEAEGWFDVFLSEGDEDAVLVSQFEESLIDTLQSDPEMAILMSSYTDARKRLLEKTRNRGFWPTPKGKGSSKGKGKFKSRKTLAQRIAESNCRKCGQRGHWKAECPMDSNNKAKPSHVANAVVSSTQDIIDEDIIFAEPDDPEKDRQTEACVFASVMGRDGNKHRDRTEKIVRRFKHRLKQVLFPKNQVSLNRNHDETVQKEVTTTPSVKVDIGSCNRSGVAEEPTQAPRDPLLPKSNDNPKMTIAPHECHEAVFASYESYGIVDLGASQTVMGQNQVDELLRALPKRARDNHYFADVNMTFRFGNNGTVDCTQALFVPVGKVWLKIALVSSKTPFLISNSVFRSLGAVIDTANQEVYFRRLDCSVPLKLSDRKLFLLNLCDLIRRAEEKEKTVPAEAEKPNVVLTTTVREEDTTKEEKSNDDKPDNPEKDNDSFPTIQHGSQDNESYHRPKECSKLSTSDRDIKHAVSGESRFGQPLRESPEGHTAGRTHCQVHEDVDAGASGTDHQVRNSQTWSTIPSGGPRGPGILPMVPKDMGIITEGGTSRICVLSGNVHGTQGDGGTNMCREESVSQESGGNTETQDEGPTISTIDEQLGRVDRRAGLCRCGQAGGAEPPGESDGRSSEPDRSAVAAIVAASSESNSAPVNLVKGSEAEKSFLQQCVNETNAYIHSEGSHHGWGNIFETEDTQGRNWVAEEMKNYFRRQGYKGRGVTVPSKPRSKCELLEIYCSADSQLTKQSLRQGNRVGLRQGDLQYQDNRHKLYDILYFHQPRDIWMSPACKAWNKWSIFNSHRSISSAKKVMLAREEDEVHLLLCAAIFEWQCSQGPTFHFHLEQPVGSEMLYEQPLQEIIRQSQIVRCDMCVAGKLTHPESQKPLQKGTQIITTSAILARGLETLKCQHHHQHDQIAGSYKTAEGKRELVSKYTELYTASFANRVIRTLQTSQKVQEKRVSHPTEIVMIGEEAEAEEQSVKRRRLAEKQNRPPAYADSSVPPPSNSEEGSENQPKTITIEDITQKCLEIAPRVGKIVLEGGETFDHIQEYFNTINIRVIEVAKGVDRFRKPPVKLVKGEAPQRYAFGTQRSGDVFDTQQWENWEQKSVRQMTCKSPPMRMLVTVFGKTKEEMCRSERPEERDNREERSHEPPFSESDETPPTKRHKPGEINKESPETPSQPGDKTGDQELLKNMPYQTHGPKFRSLSSEKQQWLKKIHINLGHPNKQKLVSVLRDQGYPQELFDALEDFHCSSCFENSLPKTARPASLPETREFNDCVGCDLVTWTSKAGRCFTFVHFIDMATNFHQAVGVHQTDAEGLFEAFKRAWLHWAGACKQLVTDNESALCSEKFGKFMQERNIHIRTVAAYAHWQNGKTERHGEILQQMLKRCDSDHPINSSQEFSDILEQCCNAKNSLARHRGYTPEILVLGKSQSLPASNVTDTSDAAQYLAEQESPEGLAFRKQLEKRESARKAFIEMDHHERIRRATLRKHHPFRGNHKPGALVMFWRPGRGEAPGHWSGPAQVIIQESTSVVWISHASRVYRVAPEHVRLLSDREINQHLPKMDQQQIGMIPNIIGPGVFQYEDMIGLPESQEIQIPPEEIPNETPGENSHSSGGQEAVGLQPDAEQCSF